MASEFLFLIAKYEDMRTTEEQQEYIESIELFIKKCRESANAGEEFAPDSVYDTAIETLGILSPDNPLLSSVWSEDDENAVFDADLDKQLSVHSMMSIQTIKDLSVKAFSAYCSRIDDIVTKRGSVNLHFSFKENGHGIRFVYKDGHFAKAHTRGRSSNGRDITHAISLLVPEYIEQLADKGIVEFRGEVLLPLSKLSEARKFKPDIKSAFTGVSAMIRESASDEEIKLLQLAVYAVYSDNLSFQNLSDAYRYIASIGFTTPTQGVLTYNQVGTLHSMVEKVLEKFETIVQTYDFYTDGVVLSVDDLSLLESMGTENSYKLGNVALKVGYWSQNMYSAVIQKIIWKEGRSKLTPVAEVTPTLTATGATVTNVPLYAPVHILRLEAYPGRYINFRFGGEAGVVPCFPNGKLVTEV